MGYIVASDNQNLLEVIFESYKEGAGRNTNSSILREDTILYEHLINFG